MLNRLGFLILEVSLLGLPVIWNFSQPSSHTWRCNSWTRCQMCHTCEKCHMSHMWKMSHLSHVSRDTVRLLLFLVYNFKCNWSSVHRFRCIYPPFGDSSGLPISPSPGMSKKKEGRVHLCERQVRTNQSIIMRCSGVSSSPGLLPAAPISDFCLKFILLLMLLLCPTSSSVKVSCPTIKKNCSLEHLWNSHCPIDI